MSKTVKFHLTSNELEVLDRPLIGDGGFQRFGRKLQGLVNRRTSTIKLSDADLGRIIRHISYNPGGFEDRLRGAFGSNLTQIIIVRGKP